ncbi:MAG TPA: hypothetical protein VMH79_03490 [Thermoanaerobaculia bacterium]|nr:hypothetical protein [Thermoanaerobaculia bacterium]
MGGAREAVGTLLEKARIGKKRLFHHKEVSMTDRDNRSSQGQAPQTRRPDQSESDSRQKQAHGNPGSPRDERGEIVGGRDAQGSPISRPGGKSEEESETDESA